MANPKRIYGSFPWDVLKENVGEEVLAQIMEFLAVLVDESPAETSCDLCYEAGMYALLEKGLDAFSDIKGEILLAEAAELGCDEAAFATAKLVLSGCYLAEGIYVPNSDVVIDVGWAFDVLDRLACKGYDDAKLELAYYRADKQAIRELVEELDYPLAEVRLATLSSKDSEGVAFLLKRIDQAAMDPVARLERALMEGRLWGAWSGKCQARCGTKRERTRLHGGSDMNGAVFDTFLAFGFSPEFIQDEYDLIPSVFELNKGAIEEYLEILRHAMGERPVVTYAIERALYEDGNNDVFESFDYLAIGRAEEEIPIACQTCISLYEKRTGCAW